MEASGWKPLPTPQPQRRNHKKNKEELLEPVPTPEALNMSEWDQIFDLRSDRKKVLFGIGLATLGGTALLIVYLIVSCFRRI